MDIQKFKGKYFGPNKITEISISKGKTYLGKEKVELVFENLEKAIYPLETVNDVATDQSLDISRLQDKRVKPVIEKFLIILVESELNKDDITVAIGTRLQGSLEASAERASEILWGKKDHEITLMDIEKVISKNKSGRENRNKN